MIKAAKIFLPLFNALNENKKDGMVLCDVKSRGSSAG